jgi:hypothetical protein
VNAPIPSIAIESGEFFGDTRWEKMQAIQKLQKLYGEYVCVLFSSARVYVYVFLFFMAQETKQKEKNK